MKPHQEVCRLCLLQLTTSEDASLEDSAVFLKLKTIFSCAFTLHFVLPKRVCSKCLVKVHDIELFFDTVRKNQEQLCRRYKLALQNSETTEQSIKISPVKIKTEQPDDTSEEHNIHPGCEIDIEISEVKIEPESCSDQDVDQLTTQQHHKQFEHDQVQCKLCSALFPSSDLFRDHMVTAHGRFQCLQCKGIFTNKGSLGKHLLQLHGIRQRKFPCLTCGEKFNSKHDHMHHVARAECASSVRCHLCQKKLKNRKVLRAHIQNTHHSVDEELACEICNRTYRHAVALASHKRKVHGDPKFHCEICGKAFTVRCKLKEHQEVKHRDGKSYFCAHCGTSYSTKWNLYKHIRDKHPLEWNDELKREKGTS